MLLWFRNSFILAPERWKWTHSCLFPFLKDPTFKSKLSMIMKWVRSAEDWHHVCLCPFYPFHLLLWSSDILVFYASWVCKNYSYTNFTSAYVQRVKPSDCMQSCENGLCYKCVKHCAFLWNYMVNDKCNLICIFSLQEPKVQGPICSGVWLL